MKKTLCLLLCLLICIVSCGITVAWLGAVLGVARFPTEFTGSANAAYFAGGNGSEEKPYEISNAVHLYNLAWLQYLGYFNMNPDMSNKLAQSYFKLTADIDMGRLKSAIPPIGTTQYPFIGHFDGGNFTIRSLTVSNAKGDTAKTLKVRPSNAEFQNSNNTETDLLHTTDKASEIEIVGLFGVTGNYNGYTDGYAEDNADFVKEEMSVSGFYADKLHVNSNTAQTLVGLVGGYIGSNFANVGVYRGDISLVSGVTGIAALSGGASVVSKYSLVGAYNEKLVVWTGLPGGWGGSIDMKSLYTRIDNLYKDDSSTSVSIGSYTYKYYYSEDVGSVYMRFYGDIYYLRGGSKLSPGKAEYDMTNSAKKPTYFPINTDANNNATDNNTGYIASGPFDSLGGDIRLRGASINGSVGVEISTNGADSFGDGKEVEILTITTDGLKRISDSFNENNSNVHSSISSNINKETVSSLGLNAYDTAREKFNAVIQGQEKWYGFHFMDAAIGMDNIYTASKVKINGDTFYNYPMPANSIDFQVKSKGYISCFAATNFQSNRSFFSLHQIFRNTDNSIKEIKEISKIYSDDGAYIYLYSDNTTSKETVTASALTESYSLAFDCSWIASDTYTSGLMIRKAIYYLEIPVNEGEYALGSSSTGAGAYLLYLDIGANGTDGGGSGEKPYTMETVDFVNTDTIVLDANNAYPAYKAVIMSLADVATSGTPYILYERATGTEVEDSKIATKLLYKYEGIGTLTVLPGGMAETGNLTDYRDEVAGSG